MNIAATQAKAFHSEGGQWIRVTCPGFNIVSVYRRPKLSKMLADTFDESLGQDLATVSNIPFLAVGDFKQDPLTFGKPRFPQAQILCPTQDSSESDVEIQIPEPTRWDGTVCLDWGLCHDVQCNVVTKENKWSDHKLLHWSIPHIGISRIRIRKFAPRPNLAEPENVTQDRWNDVLRQNWHLLEDEIPKDSTWERLCGVTQIACTKALEILAPERRQPKKGHKGQVAETIDVYRRHKTNPEGDLTIRFKRIQRLWRRLQAFKAGDTNPDLGRAILRESRFLTKQVFGLDQTSIHALAKWISQELDLICQTEKTDEFSSGKTKFPLTKNSVGNLCPGTKRSFLPTALPLKRGKCCLMMNFSNLLKITGEMCGPKPKTLSLNRPCVSWLRTPIRIQFLSRQVFLP